MKSDQPTVFVLAAGHNECEVVNRLFTHLARQTYPKIEMVFVDDGSTDGTSKFLREAYPKTTLLAGDGNLWWTGAMAKGVAEILKRARADDFIFTINNDCTFDDNLIEILVRTSLAHQRAVVGSLAVDRADRTTIWDGGVVIDWRKGTLKGLGPKNVTDLPKDATVQPEIDTLSTKGTLYPIEAFQRAGNFAARALPHYASDYEMGCRAKGAGFPLLLSYQARVYNEVTRTGFGETLPKQISFAEFRKLMFGRRSRVNIIDHWQLVRLTCPPRHKPVNYLRVVGKFIYYLCHIPPLTLFLGPIQKLRQRFA